jgi:predicted ester cyclase
VLAVAFPDARHEFTSIVEAGEDVALEAIWTGTHTGPLATPMGEIPPTTSRVEVPMLIVAKVRDGLIASTHIYYDQVGMLSALGLMPAPASA